METVWSLMQNTFLGSTVALACMTNIAFAEVLRCDVSAKFACGPSGCEPNRLGVHNIVDLEAKKFARCDSKGCDSYDAVIQRSGVYITVDVPGRGMFAKVSSDGSQFVEVVSLGTSVFASFGSCRIQ
jgi:hypothetical protein